MRSAILGLLLLSVLALPSTALADNVSDAKKLIGQNRLRGAADILKAVTEKNAEDAKAWALLADVALKISDLETARKAADNALELDDKTVDHWLLMGKVAFEKGIAAYDARQPGNTIKSWFAESEMKFKQCLKLDPGNKEVRCLLGWSKEWQEYPKKAREIYEEQIRKFPGEPMGYVRLGAMIANEAIGTDNGTTPEAQRVRQGAIDVFEKGVKKASPDADLLYNLGLALEWAGKKEEGKARYFESIDADPDYWKSWKRIYDLEGRNAGAVLLPLAKKQLAKHKNNGTAAYWAGYYLCAQRKYEEALSILLPALKKSGEYYLVYNQAFTAASALLQGRVRASEAVEALKKIHEYYWYSGSAANNVGLYFRDSGSYKESLQWYAVSAEREPENQDLLNDYALIFLFHTSQKKKSLPILLRVVALVEENGQKPIRGYWDALENLCKYYWEVDRDPEKVIAYATRRYEEVEGVKPYNMSGNAAHWKQLAKKELEKRRKTAPSGD